MIPPIIIVGAARSGTNMLRDALVRLPEFVTWPCDEINYIWRYGNRSVEHDEFTREMATNKVRQFLHRAVRSINRKSPRATVVEKTCATSLRCEFADEVFPESKFVQITRDGRDVAASAAQRWNAGLDVPYLIRKARYVPPADMIYYASRYLHSRTYLVRSGHKRLNTWGPKFKGMAKIFEQHELPVGCAIQWARCVQSSNVQLSTLDSQRVYSLTYENFVSDPEAEFIRLCQFLGVEVTPALARLLTQNISARSVGSWRKKLSNAQVEQIETNVGDTLARLGYLT